MNEGKTNKINWNRQKVRSKNEKRKSMNEEEIKNIKMEGGGGEAPSIH
jgi:hypothetical protein